MENPKFRGELVNQHRSLTLPTLVIHDELVLGFGINKNRIIKKLNLKRR